MIPQPTTSTLFPYTTLFRSKTPPTPMSGNDGPTRERTLARIDVDGSMSGAPESPPASDDANGRAIVVLDRKSTRLNSSHRCISYAVFCLKKKKTTTQLKMIP